MNSCSIIMLHAGMQNPYKGPFGITHCGTNGPVTLQYVLTKISNNSRWIKLYTSDTNIEDITTENMYVDFNI